MLSAEQLRVVAAITEDGLVALETLPEWQEAEEEWDAEAERLIEAWQADPNRTPWRPEPTRTVSEIFVEMTGYHLVTRYAVDELASEEAYELARAATEAMADAGGVYPETLRAVEDAIHETHRIIDPTTGEEI